MSYEASKTDLLLASAFCEEVYRRDSREQSLGETNGDYKVEGFESFFHGAIAIQSNPIDGLTATPEGYYYNDSTGFVGNYGDSASN